MYDTPDGYSQYKEMDLAARTAAASPLELVLVLFSGLMDELERAKSHIENKRYERKAQSINKCIDILNALTSSLEFETGGELVVNLWRRLPGLHQQVMRDFHAYAAWETDAEALREVKSRLLVAFETLIARRTQRAEELKTRMEKHQQNQEGMLAYSMVNLISEKA